MGSDWPVVRLGDYVDACLGKMLDKEKNKGQPHKYLGNKSVRWGSFDLDDLSEMLFEEREYERYEIKYGDLIICEGGEPGRCAIWKEAVPNMKIQKALHRVRTKKGLEGLYLYYWFLWSGRTGRLEQYFTGTTIKHFTGKALSSVEISLPPVSIQKNIGRLLNSLDNKIQLNRETNQTLEAMAQALFKSWFVDFDPVFDNIIAHNLAHNNAPLDNIPEPLLPHAQRRLNVHSVGRGSARQTAAHAFHHLFPQAFEQSDEPSVGIQGWVPKGWKYKTLGEKMTPSKGKNITKSTVVEGNVPVVAGGLSPAYYHNQHNVCAPVITVSASGANAGFVNLYYDNIWASDCSYINKTHTEFVFTTYLFLNNRQIEITRMQQGAAQPHVYPKDLMRLELADPTADIWNFFEKIVTPNFEKISKNKLNIQSLESLRDTLLPKLISGELRIPDAEQATEALAK